MMTRTISSIALTVAAITANLTVSACIPADSYEPQPFNVIDGDTFTNGKGERLRLMRIDAPELPGHPCPVAHRPSCIDNDPVRAGEAKQKLQDFLLHANDLVCETKRKDVYGRRLVECISYGANQWGAPNLSDRMLLTGLVNPYIP